MPIKVLPETLKDVVNELKLIISAQDDLLVCYRLGKQPKDKTFQVLETKNLVLFKADSFLNKSN